MTTGIKPGSVAARVRAPWAASVAGLVFAALFTTALVLIRSQPITSMSDTEITAWFASGADYPSIVGALYMAPFAGIAFLWFIGVIRDQLGEREDQFFATVFFGSGVLFVAMFFAAVAVTGSIEISYRYLHDPAPTADEVASIQALGYTLMFVFATRVAAVFIISTATVGLRAHVFPRWFGLIGVAIGVGLLLGVNFLDWSVLLLPLWVAMVSLLILTRERQRRDRRVAEAAA